MTQCEKILVLMIRRYHTQKVFRASDFMPPQIGFNDECFVGYEASARMSDVASDYPDLVETGKDGRFRTLRLRIDNLGVALPKLNPQLRQLLIEEMLEHGVRPEYQV